MANRVTAFRNPAPIVPQNTPLLQMPLDIIIQILTRLHPQDIGTSSLVCRHMSRILKYDEVWHILFYRHFPSICPSIVENFKGAYQALYSNLTKGVYVSRAFEGHIDSVRTLITADGTLFSGSDDSTIKVWDIKTGKCVATLIGHKDGVRSLTIADGILLSASDDKTIKTWDIKTGKSIATFVGHENRVNSIAIADGILFSASEDKTIKTWDIKTGKCTETFEGYKDGVNSIAIADGILFSASYDKTIKAWDIKTGKCTAILTGHRDWVLCLAMVNGILFSGSEDKTIKAWDTITGKCVATLVGHKEEVNSIAIVGGLLFSTSDDNTIKVWDIKTYRCIWTLEEHKENVSSLAIMDGMLFSGSFYKTIKTLDFTADHSAVFYEIAELFKNGGQETIKYTLERFSRMPKNAKEAIYEKLYEILKPFKNEYDRCAEDAFHDQNEQNSTPLQKAQAIIDYLDELTPVKSFITPSSARKANDPNSKNVF